MIRFLRIDGDNISVPSPTLVPLLLFALSTATAARAQPSYEKIADIANQQIVGPPNWMQTSNCNAVPGAVLSQSFGRPTGPSKVMSFGAFCKAKSGNRQESIKQPCKKFKKPDEEVSIFIGQKQLSQDRKLKTKWGKRLPVTVEWNLCCHS